MRKLNIEFLEEYKQVDKLIKDAYQSETGITTYISYMENYNLLYGRVVDERLEDYKMIKRVRWIRNQLSHDVSIDSDICEEKDYQWLLLFHKSLLRVEDPISIMRRNQNRNTYQPSYNFSNYFTKKKDNIYIDAKTKKRIFISVGVVVVIEIIVLILLLVCSKTIFGM